MELDQQSECSRAARTGTFRERIRLTSNKEGLAGKVEEEMIGVQRLRLEA